MYSTANTAAFCYTPNIMVYEKTVIQMLVGSGKCSTFASIISKNDIMMNALSTKNAPAAIGPYSQAIEANGFVFASGQLPIDPATGAFPEGGIKEQTRQSILNAQAILQSAGLDLCNVVKTTVLLADIADFGDMNGVYSEFFSEPFPARSAFAVKALPKGAMVEIEMIAAKK